MALKSVFITSGDTDGIGLEVSCKALLQIGPKRGIKFILFGTSTHFKKWRPALSKKFRSQTSFEFIDRTDLPIEWVKTAAKSCLKSPKSSALVTGPLSKTGIIKAGYDEVGHTELLKKWSSSKSLFQVYLGSKMNVILATDHISLAKVPHRLLEKDRLKKAITQALLLQKKLRLKGSIALLALDPHAGEEGIIGTQDQAHLEIIKSFKGRNRILGPLPADSAFHSEIRKNVGLYVALYHDQGLIPFKALHGFGEGVHLTAGLPFVRTSVDHGTGKNIFGKNQADPGSMKDAILTAIKIVGV